MKIGRNFDPEVPIYQKIMSSAWLKVKNRVEAEPNNLAWETLRGATGELSRISTESIAINLAIKEGEEVVND